MQRSGIRAAFLAFLIGCAGALAGDDPVDLPVAVRAGKATVRLDVALHFADAALGLPAPGELPVTDEHDKGHGARTYCYRFAKFDEAVLVEFYDSDFGLHTARLSRIDGGAHPDCPLLMKEPRVMVGKTEFTLGVGRVPTPGGFQVRTTGESLVISRSWSYSERKTVPSCISREISVTIEPPAGVARSLTVQNWAEPGC